MPRMTRKEKQAHTRSCLMESAARLFTRRGLERASVEEVAEDAGYTKGAFYANFKSKEELFLAMLDERFAERVEELDAVMASDASPEDMARRAGDDFMRHLGANQEWERLFFEFTAHAARDEDFREELVTRYRALRERIAELLERAASEETKAGSPVGPDQLALMVFAMANGVALEKLLEPEAVSEDLYGTMLTIFFTGLNALARGQTPLR